MFVSYSREDQGYVDKLDAAFATRQIPCWIDRDIDYGSRWPRVIKEHIDSSAVVIVVMTPDAEDSVWVGREIDQAESTARPILPVLLRGQRFFRLAEHQFEDVRDGGLPSERWFRRVGELAGTVAVAAPTTTSRPNARKAQKRFERADMLLGVGREEEALAELDLAVAEAPGSAANHNLRGVALRRLGRHDEALASYQRATALDPRFALAWHNIAVVLWHLGRYGEAVDAADRALALDPKLDKAHNSRGLALQELGQVEAALAAYDKAIALNPRYAFGFNNRGTLLLDRGEYDRALKDFDRAVALDPTFALAHQNRGKALASLGRTAESRASFERALELSD